MSAKLLFSRKLRYAFLVDARYLEIKLQLLYPMKIECSTTSTATDCHLSLLEYPTIRLPAVVPSALPVPTFVGGSCGICERQW